MKRETIDVLLRLLGLHWVLIGMTDVFWAGGGIYGDWLTKKEIGIFPHLGYANVGQALAGALMLMAGILLVLKAQAARDLLFRQVNTEKVFD